MAALAAWRQQQPALAVVVLSAERERSTMRAVLAAGAAGFVPKAAPQAVMAKAFELVLDGGRYVPPELLDEAAPLAAMPSSAPAVTPVPAVHAALPPMTGRQRAVFDLLAAGAPNKIICRELGLAERTVKAHITAVFRALQVDNRAQVAAAAARLGIAVEPYRRRASGGGA
jgi:two-component system, NarL family, nitrate/nitrite response regulator NarL